MERRDFIASSAALLVSPRRLWAQGTPRRVGYFGGFRDASIFKVWQESLRDHGWVDGKNVVIDYRYWEGHAERIPALAAWSITTRADAIIVTALIVIGSQPVKGDDDAAKKLHGVWRLTYWLPGLDSNQRPFD